AHKKARGIEAPPVPLQHVGRDVAAVQSRHDELEYRVHVLSQKTQHYPDGHHAHAYRVVHRDDAAGAGVRVEVLEEPREHQPYQPGRQKAIDGEGQNALEVDGAVGRPQVELVVVEQPQNGEPDNERVADGQQNNRHKAAHFAGLLGRARAQDFLHVVVGRGTGQRGKNPFKGHHHEENAEQRVAVAGYFAVDL
nr:hypothetical protein [Tanacetum cinerariifolium]